LNKRIDLPDDGKRKKAVVQHNLSRSEMTAFEKSKAVIFVFKGGI
jgi:hypothetical protein